MTSYEQLGRYEDALAAFRKGGRSAGYRIARVLARAGRSREADRILAELTPGLPEAGDVASVYAALGRRDEAFELLFTAADRGFLPRFLAIDPPFEPLHGDPRWPELVRRAQHPR